MSTMTTPQELAELVLDLLPEQGEWSDQAYLWLTDRSNHLIELTDGYIEVLPMPTHRHQAILRSLFLAFHAFLQQHGVNGGNVFFAPLRLQIRPGKFREPDLILVQDAHDSRQQDQYWLGADLVVEIVSPDKPERDLVEKRRDYAEARIPEYWIVNPLDETIAVLRLEEHRYVEHGRYQRGTTARSVLFPAFAVSTSAVFDAN
jgi:Uma2 family endonuclease